ncbi:MAG: hypothetical protein QXL94_01365 [Candidatus Parvarchaeum sp.]
MIKTTKSDNDNYEIVPVEQKAVKKYNKYKNDLMNIDPDFVNKASELGVAYLREAERIYQNNPNTEVELGSFTAKEHIEPLRSGFFRQKTVYDVHREFSTPQIRLRPVKKRENEDGEE